MNQSLLSRIINGAPKSSIEDEQVLTITSAAQPTMPPFVSVLLKQFGITPEAINTYAEGLRDAIVGELSAIRAKLDTIEMKVSEIENNQRVLLEAASKDAEHDSFLVHLESLGDTNKMN
jgi:hypothetical protein